MTQITSCKATHDASCVVAVSAIAEAGRAHHAYRAAPSPATYTAYAMASSAAAAAARRRHAAWAALQMAKGINIYD